MDVDITNPARIEINSQTVIFIVVHEGVADTKCLTIKVVSADSQFTSVVLAPPGLWESRKIQVLLTRPDPTLEVMAIRYGDKMIMSLSGWKVVKSES